MAISTYEGLIAAVMTTLKRSDIAASINDWIYLCEQELNLILHRREMTQRATANTVAGQATYALPTDFGEAIAMHVNASPIAVLDPSDWDRIKLLYQSQGQPLQWCLNGNEFMLGPTPDAVYQLELYYYKTLPNLTGASPTNWLLTSYPKVYLYGTLVEAANNLVDEPRGGQWVTAYQNAIKLLLRDQIRDRGLGGGPVLRADLPITTYGRWDINTGLYR